MSVTMKVKLNDEQVKQLGRTVSREECMENNIRNAMDLAKYKHNKIVNELAIESGYHPAGYGIWNVHIIKQEDGYYGVWERGNTCD